jgi:hypothetical protein
LLSIKPGDERFTSHERQPTEIDQGGSLCGTLLLSDSRWGLVIVLLGSIIAAGMPVLHMTGAGVGVKRSAGAFFFIWTLYMLGVTGTFGIILSARALWTKRAIARQR